MVLSTINSDGEAVSKYKVDIIFISKGNVVELDEVPTLGDIIGVLEKRFQFISTQLPMESWKQAAEQNDLQIVG